MEHGAGEHAGGRRGAARSSTRASEALALWLAYRDGVAERMGLKMADFGVLEPVEAVAPAERNDDARAPPFRARPHGARGVPLRLLVVR